MTTWFVTGASSGLGRQLAHKALDEGAEVVLANRARASVEDLLARFPRTALHVPLDVTDAAQAEVAVAQARDRFGGIDVLVNNAGYGYRAAIEEGEEPDVDRLFATHVFGPLRLIRAVLPGMRQQRSGTIVNVSSMATRSMSPGSGYYVAAKAAVEAFSGSLHREVRPLGIRVLVLQLGAFRTDFAGRSLSGSAREIDDYEATVGSRRVGRETAHGRQPGDPRRAAAVLWDVLGQEDPPVFLPLGSDAFRAIRDAAVAELEGLERWRALGTSTDAAR